MSTVASTGPAIYRGRFAPSPSGPLHFGSLVTAVGSYLDARANGGIWLLRIEDLDQPRTQPGAADAILRTLESFGFTWDEEVVVQSRRPAVYRQALEALRAAGVVYPCACSRSEIAAHASPPSVDGGQIYPGICRSGLPSSRPARAWRLRVPASEIIVNDRLQGQLRQTLTRDVGDFVVSRTDGTFAYQLAVVVDDAAQGINAVVRGADLFDSTPRQIWLQRCLGMPTPSYAHLPVVTNTAGEKLSKQTRAPAVDPAAGSVLLAAALTFLGHRVPTEIAVGPVGEFWSWSIGQWSPSRVPAVRSIVQGCPLPP